MLVVTRRPGEAIVIELPTGEFIEVTVLGVKGNQVRLGPGAPEDILVLREELLERSELSELDSYIKEPAASFTPKPDL